MFLVHDAKLILASSINDFCRVFNAPVLDGFKELVFYGRIIGLDKVLVNELDGDRGLACGKKLNVRKKERRKKKKNRNAYQRH